MRDETVPNPPNPAEPPIAPHDLPEPAPQAAAWRRALKVVSSSTPRATRNRLSFHVRRASRG
jgi:hypothetical protein